MSWVGEVAGQVYEGLLGAGSWLLDMLGVPGVLVVAAVGLAGLVIAAWKWPVE
jgi:hypothetical protein